MASCRCNMHPISGCRWSKRPPHIFAVNCSVRVPHTGGSGAHSPRARSRFFLCAFRLMRPTGGCRRAEQVIVHNRASNFVAPRSTRPAAGAKPDGRRRPFFLAVERAKSGAKSTARNPGRHRAPASPPPPPPPRHPPLVGGGPRMRAGPGPCSVFAQGRPPAQGPAQQPAPVLGPYKPVRITLPPGVNDPTFDTFRKQLTEIANNKDRAALARLVAAN